MARFFTAYRLLVNLLLIIPTEEVLNSLYFLYGSNCKNHKTTLRSTHIYGHLCGYIFSVLHLLACWPTFTIVRRHTPLISVSIKSCSLIFSRSYHFSKSWFRAPNLIKGWDWRTQLSSYLWPVWSWSSWCSNRSYVLVFDAKGSLQMSKARKNLVTPVIYQCIMIWSIILWVRRRRELWVWLPVDGYTVEHVDSHLS